MKAERCTTSTCRTPFQKGECPTYQTMTSDFEVTVTDYGQITVTVHQFRGHNTQFPSAHLRLRVSARTESGLAPLRAGQRGAGRKRDAGHLSWVARRQPGFTRRRGEKRKARRRDLREAPCRFSTNGAAPITAECSSAYGRERPPRLPFASPRPGRKARFILSACKAVEGRETHPPFFSAPCARREKKAFLHPRVCGLSSKWNRGRTPSRRPAATPPLPSPLSACATARTAGRPIGSAATSRCSPPPAMPARRRAASA